MKLYQGEDVHIEYPGDTDVLPYEPGAELGEIPVPILTENPSRTDEEMDTEARERIPRVQQPSPTRRATQDEIQSRSSQESPANPNEATQTENQWENSEMGEVELGQESIIQWEDSSDTGVEPGQISTSAGEDVQKGEKKTAEDWTPCTTNRETIRAQENVEESPYLVKQMSKKWIRPIKQQD